MSISAVAVLAVYGLAAVNIARPRQNTSYKGVTVDFFNTEGHDRPGARRKLPWEIVDTYPDDLVFKEHDDTPRVYNADGSTTVSYFSDLRKLHPGEVVFTDPDRTKIAMPEGDIAVTSVEADVVDEKKRPVALSEVYLHHWILLDKQHPNDGVCGGYLKYIFGVGGETRNTPYDFPDYKGNHYGWFTNTAKESWTANIHVLRTVNIDPDLNEGLKGCLECHGPNKWCHLEGGFPCCPDHSMCPTIKTGTPSDDPKQYYFHYKVTFFPQSQPDVKQVANYILDVSHPACNIEYNIPTNADGIDEATITTTLPHDTRFFQMWGHIHMAGYNITLYHGDSTDSPPICTSLPGYGTVPNKPGDEKGYVVSMSKCHWDDKPYIIKKGEKITLQALYNVGDTDTRTWNTGHHDGVMGLWFMGGEKCATAGCVDESDGPRAIAPPMA
eukprot:m.411208 g.411208  ORF g.411208 m.411208 type:complete len:440 (-) comp28599_c0_seq1:2807-4126(-)